MSQLTHADLLELGRWNTPTIYNGWEQITERDSARECFNLEKTVDYMPQMGPMIGYAVTVVIEPSDPGHKKANPQAWKEYRAYIASVSGPKIVVVQDMDKPNVFGAFWGEVNANTHRALGCVGTIIDGAIRDIDEMTSAGFKALARRLCVGHANSYPMRWNCEVEVFGCTIEPGQLIHADQHGFLAIPFADSTSKLLEAARFMDSNECKTGISAAKSTTGKSTDSILEILDQADADFSAATREKFGNQGEWGAGG